MKNLNKKKMDKFDKFDTNVEKKTSYVENYNGLLRIKKSFRTSYIIFKGTRDKSIY